MEQSWRGIVDGKERKCMLGEMSRGPGDKWSWMWKFIHSNRKEVSIYGHRFWWLEFA